MSGSKIIGGISVTISATTDKFVKGITMARKVLGAFTKAVTGAIFSLKGLAVAFASGAFVKFTANAFTAIDALAKTADKLNISTEALAGFQAAAEDAGISNETLERSLTMLAKKTGKNADQALLDLVDSAQKAGSAQEQLTMATEAFGTRGSAMVRILRGGRAALAEGAKDAEKFGLAVSRGAARGVERAIMAFGDLKDAIGGVFRQVAIDIAPYVEILSTKISDFVAQGGRAQSLGSKIVDAIVGAAKFVADAVQKMVGAVMSFAAEGRMLLFEFRSGLVGKASGFGYANKSQEILAGSAAIGAQRRAARFNSAAPWSTAIEKLAGDAKALASQQAAAMSPKGDLLKRIGARFADSVMSGAASRFQNFGGPIGRLYAKSMLFGAMNPGGGAASGRSGTLTFAQSGSADSYRQQAAIRKQNESINLDKRRNDLLKGIQEKMGNGLVLMAANFGGR